MGLLTIHAQSSAGAAYRPATNGKTTFILLPGDYIVLRHGDVPSRGTPVNNTFLLVEFVNSNTLTSRRFVPDVIKSTVASGTFTNGQLQGTQPQNSVIDSKFTNANYKYEYTYVCRSRYERYPVCMGANAKSLIIPHTLLAFTSV